MEQRLETPTVGYRLLLKLDCLPQLLGKIGRLSLESLICPSCHRVRRNGGFKLGENRCEALIVLSLRSFLESSQRVSEV